MKSALVIACGIVGVGCGGGGGGLPSDAPWKSDFNAALAACIATDPATLVACAGLLQSGRAQVVELRGTITCNQPLACAVSLSRPPGPVAFVGAPGAALKRVSSFDYPLFHVVGAHTLVFSNLVLDEDQDVACDPINPNTNPPVTNTSCEKTIDVFGSDRVGLQRVTVAHSKAQAIFCNGCGELRVLSSRFVASHLFGVQVNGASALLLDGNVFHGIASNALVLYDSHGTAAAPLRVQHNLFHHNHRLNLFYSCGPQGTDPCDGGQMLMVGLLDWLSIDQNVIREGFSDAHPGANTTAGIEVNSPSIHQVSIAGNDIHANNQSAITLNAGSVSVSGISIVNNKFYGNGTFFSGADLLNLPPGADVGTCATPACRMVPLGGLWTLPGSGVQWASNDLAAPALWMANTQVSSSADGVAAAPAGALVLLKDGATLIEVGLAR